MFKKLASRKFLATLFGVIAPVLFPILGVPVAAADMAVKLIALYVGVEGTLDLASISKNKEEKKP